MQFSLVCDSYNPVSITAEKAAGIFFLCFFFKSTNLLGAQSRGGIFTEGHIIYMTLI